MTERSERDVWIEMSIREISTQSRFASAAFENIDPKAAKGTAVVFSSIHSFLSHCAMISKMLRGTDDQTPATEIGALLGVPDSSVIHNRKFRNSLEHYDERLRRWISQHGTGKAIGTYNVGPRAMVDIPNMLYVSHYDPTTGIFTFVNEDFDLRILLTGSRRIQKLADEWIQANWLGPSQPRA